MGKLDEITQLIARLGAESRPKQHYVSHQTSNLDGLLGGLEPRSYGMSFARAPHERVPSPLPENASGRPGIVFATVEGSGIDYARPNVQQVLDEAASKAIEVLGSTGSLVPQMREAGIGWVNNWNSIGAADELYVLDPRTIQIRRVFELPADRSYRFARPLEQQPPARAFGLEEYGQPIRTIRRAGSPDHPLP